MATKIRSLVSRKWFEYYTTVHNIHSRISALQRRIHKCSEEYRQHPEPEVLKIIQVYSTELLRLKQKYSVFLKHINYGSY
jgi:hypothetical protein